MIAKWNVLYDALVQCIMRMHRENKFNQYQYKFNPLIFRGSEEAMEGFTEEIETHFGTNFMQENTSVSHDQNGNVSESIKKFHTANTVYCRGGFVADSVHFERSKPYRRAITQIKLYKISKVCT